MRRMELSRQSGCVCLCLLAAHDIIFIMRFGLGICLGPRHHGPDDVLSPASSSLVESVMRPVSEPIHSLQSLNDDNSVGELDIKAEEQDQVGPWIAQDLQRVPLRTTCEIFSDDRVILPWPIYLNVEDDWANHSRPTRLDMSEPAS
jgi:hypothetical protein